LKLIAYGGTKHTYISVKRISDLGIDSG
jgi:hypothetical protein